MDDEGPLASVLPKLEVLAPARIAPRARPQDSMPAPAQRALPVQPAPVDSSSLEFSPPGDDISWEQQRGLWVVLTTLPSWLISFIVHLALILALATITYVANQDGTIFLEISQVDSESLSESVSMEITLEESKLEDSFEALESDEVLESELPLLDLTEAALPEVYETSDPFVLTGLPEFSSKPVIPAAKKPAKKESSGAGIDFFGTKSYGSEFVFVIDCSSSMSVDYRWDRAVNELVATLDQFDREQKFLVMLYNDKNYMMFGAPESQKLIPATEENKARISYWLSKATPFAGTQPAKSVRLALRKKPDAIYFLSDGELRDHTMRALRSWNVPRVGSDGNKRLTPIHTILLGSNFGRLTMQTIAEENNGIFTHAR